MAILLSSIGDVLATDESLEDLDVRGNVEKEYAWMALLMKQRFRNWYVGFFDTWQGGVHGDGLQRHIITSSPRREEVVQEVYRWHQEPEYAKTVVTIDCVKSTKRS